jgi:hypothetical protein
VLYSSFFLLLGVVGEFLMVAGWLFPDFFVKSGFFVMLWYACSMY